VSIGTDRVKYWCVNVPIEWQIYKTAYESHGGDFTPYCIVTRLKRICPKTKQTWEGSYLTAIRR
jgi:hypothetical protein